MARPRVTERRIEKGLYEVTRTPDVGPARVTFKIRYSDGAGRMLCRTFSTESKARLALARARTQVMDGDHINPGSGDTKFLKVAEDWIASHPDWKQRTRKANQWTVDKKLIDLHDKRMKQVTTDSLFIFRIQLLATEKRDGTMPAPSSVKRTMGVIYAICEHARLKKHITVNPCLDLPAWKVRTPEVVVPTLRELADLIAALAAPTPERTDSRGRTYASKPADPRFALLVETAAWSGLRAGELAGLKKSDLDFDAGTISVRRTIIDIKGGLAEDTPKSPASRRTVEIDPDLARRLEKHTLALRPGDYVFGGVGRDGDRKPLRHNQFQGRAFRTAAGALGLHITFHDLRHFHASVLIADGWSLLEVSRRLGHDDPSFTARRYSHYFRLRESDEGARIGALRSAGVATRRPRPKKPRKPF